MDDFLNVVMNNLGAFLLLSASIFGLLHFIFVDWLNIRNRKQIDLEYLKYFNDIIAGINSSSPTHQLSSAVILRRYLKRTKYKGRLRHEALNSISAILRTLPTGILQKTIADGLAFANNLNYLDLQNTNLQRLYLGTKKIAWYIPLKRISLRQTDLFCANLSNALIENVNGRGAIFYCSILGNASIKNSDFTNANFCKADLSNVTFDNVILYHACFQDAIGIPELIAKNLDDYGRFMLKSAISVKKIKKQKKIFFSMPGSLSTKDELITIEYKKELERKGFSVIYYQRDHYPHGGQLSKIRTEIESCCGMIVFGLKQILIHKATYRPLLVEEKQWANQWLTTPWCELEVGMGIMNKIPLLIVKDSEITEGVFDECLSESFVFRIDANSDIRKLSSSTAFHDWLEQIN